MKLLQKTSRIYLAASLVTYLVVGIAFYWIIKFIIYDEVESRLMVEKQDFETYIRANDMWSSNSYFVENKIEAHPVFGKFKNEVVFTDTLIRNRYEESVDPFRQVSFYTLIGGTPYRVSIRKSMIESYKLIEAISATMITCLALLMVGMFFFQRRLSGQLWQPFYDSLSKIKNFDWTRNEKLSLTRSEITEFNELEDVMEKMASKMQHDYKSLREFTENASHEIQTPLALINARVEQFIQSKDLGENHTYWIEEIYHAARRMSRLNQGLLLLAKIENQQFTDQEEIDLSELIKDKIKDFEDIIHHKNIRVDFKIEGSFGRLMSPSLADILLSNLLNNAIKHNHTDGTITIEAGEHYLEISNSGSVLKGNPERLFERFKKESTGTESLGLGLAIVKQICDNYNLQIAYNTSDSMHTILISK
ncbi:HAMP domain-containing sensor histidine kinase [Dyadobacter sp. CY323]|uniref:sensor histidine kinase n=1 Tax=Dyadobacter sp. CY323 TaxID=2907302 RepID=UPI001F1B6B01|nr:HAMP domain-containing sensor histidine kinase [Dyadobacter sp. CY323]MCE6992221.1 HAMP domain-containing histidine kinase [Dyadobacter sp. CY323]